MNVKYPKYTVCPNCGGKMYAETVGWRCEKCRGFVDLQGGKFYEYKERAFMPPMTNADHIRSMDDSKLEDFIRKIYLRYEPWCDRHCNNSEDANCNDCLRMWLKSPVEVESNG